MKAAKRIFVPITTGVILLVISLTLAQTTDAASVVSVAGGSTRELVTFDTLVPQTHDLSSMAEITFTPAFTVYLPLITNALVEETGCSSVPELLSPVDGSDLDTRIPLYRVRLPEDPDATTLRLEVASDPDFENRATGLWSGAWSGVREHRFWYNLEPETQYYWRAWVVCGEEQGPYTEVWSFTAGSSGEIPSAPMLTSPTDGSLLTSMPVTLSWSAVPGAEQYKACWRTAEGGGTYCWITADTQVTTDRPDPSATYEWWVEARNDYAVSAESERWEFTTPAQVVSFSPESLDSGGYTVTQIEGETCTFGDRR